MSQQELQAIKDWYKQVEDKKLYDISLGDVAHLFAHNHALVAEVERLHRLKTTVETVLRQWGLNNPTNQLLDLQEAMAGVAV